MADIGDTCHGVNDDDKIYYVNSNKDMALALSSDMDDLWIAVLLQSLFLLQYCPLLRVLSIAL